MTETTPAEKKGAKVTPFTPFERFKANLELEAGITSDNGGSDIMSSVVNKMMDLDDLDAVLEAQDSSLTSGKDIIDVEITITDFIVRKGDEKYTAGGLGFYLVVDATNLETGDSFQFSVGAPNVVTALWKVREFNALPFEGVIKAKDTANGQLLTLKRVPKRVVRG